MNKNFSLSTSWNSGLHKDGFGIIEEIKRIGFDTVELNFALTEAVVNDILRLKEDSKVKVSSLHNMCPLPKEISPKDASPDYYSLASSDRDERALAVKIAKNTIDFARKFDAKAIVLHAGRIPIKDRMRELARSFDDKDKFKILRGEMIKEREDGKNGRLANVIKSLEELIPYAKTKDVAIGIENRYYYREIPLIDELAAIFKKFKYGDLYYWHDVGHAEVFERLELVCHKDLLDKFSSRLIGIHLHDIIGLTGDHNPPGKGTFDFKIIKPYLSKDIIKVIEVHQPANAEDVRKGTEYLTKILEAR